MKNILFKKICFIPNCSKKGHKKYGHRCFIHQHANICQSDECDGLAYDMKRYCQIHSCSEPDCEMRVSFLNNHLNDHLYCPEHNKLHICHMKTCNNYIDDNKKFCILHQCSLENCKNLVRYGSYCPNHTCQIDNCYNSVHDNKSLCYIHYNFSIIELNNSLPLSYKIYSCKSPQIKRQEYLRSNKYYLEESPKIFKRPKYFSSNKYYLETSPKFFPTYQY